MPQDLNWDLWLGQSAADRFSGRRQKPQPLSQRPLPFSFPLVVRIFRRQDDRLGSPSRRHRPLGPGGRRHRPCGSVEGTAEFPVPMQDGMPTESNRYNTAHRFAVTCRFANDVILEILSASPRASCSRGSWGGSSCRRGACGKPVNELADRPLPHGLITQLCKGKTPGNHMRNFVECLRDRSQPISDAWSHHRAVSTCHLANIAIRLGRKIQWDPAAQADRRRPTGRRLFKARAAQGIRDRGLSKSLGSLGALPTPTPDRRPASRAA